MSINNDNEKSRIQAIITWTGISLLIIKVLAYYLTNSIAILTDALESIVNVLAGIMGWYTIKISNRPQDKDHPYGHGKIEYISSAIEGVLIAITAVFIAYKGLLNILEPQPLQSLDLGLYLIAFTAIVNFIIGRKAVLIGKKTYSSSLIASGKHLQTDTYSTLSIILGLCLGLTLNLPWMDGLLGLILSVLLLRSAYTIVRHSIAGIMDESDEVLISELIEFIDQQRKDTWIDLHNLRIINYGSTLHIDAHITLPWYISLQEAHNELDELQTLIKQYSNRPIELFIHSDPCIENSCSVCLLKECTVRKHDFKTRISWKVENVLPNRKHSV